MPRFGRPDDQLGQHPVDRHHHERHAERARLDKKIKKLQKQAHGLERKLSNEKFVSRAPAEVVEKERTWLEETRQSIALLQAQVERLTD